MSQCFFSVWFPESATTYKVFYPVCFCRINLQYSFTYKMISVCVCVWVCLVASLQIHPQSRKVTMAQKQNCHCSRLTDIKRADLYLLPPTSQSAVRIPKKKRSRSSFLKRGEEGEEEGEEEEDEGEVYEGNRSKEGREQLGAGDGSWKLKKTPKDLSPAFSHPVQVLGFEPNQKCVCLQVKKCWEGGGGLTWCCWHRPLPSGKRK